MCSVTQATEQPTIYYLNCTNNTRKFTRLTLTGDNELCIQ